MLGIGVKLSTMKIAAERSKRIVTTIVLMTLYMLEALCIRHLPSVDDKAYYILQLFLVPSLVLTLLVVPLPLSEHGSKLCRSLSTSIYFQHRIWMALLAICGLHGNVVLLTGLTLLLCLLTYIAASVSGNRVQIRLLC